MNRLIPLAIAALLGTSAFAHAQSISAPSEPVKAAAFGAGVAQAVFG